MRLLPRAFYLGTDVVEISRRLIGKKLCTRIPCWPSPRGGSAVHDSSETVVTGGIIVETEAYAGPIDRASHAYGNRRTARTEIMFRDGGIAYVYLCYGIHSLFNVVTNEDGIPHAILVRAIEPTTGIERMLQRRGMKRLTHRLTAGPGALTQALGITVAHTGTPITSRRNAIWIEDSARPVADSDILASPRVGVDYAGEHAALPWRFRLRGSPWVSRAG